MESDKGTAKPSCSNEASKTVAKPQHPEGVDKYNIQTCVNCRALEKKLSLALEANKKLSDTILNLTEIMLGPGRRNSPMNQTLQLQPQPSTSSGIQNQKAAYDEMESIFDAPTQLPTPARIVPSGRNTPQGLREHLNQHFAVTSTTTTISSSINKTSTGSYSRMPHRGKGGLQCLLCGAFYTSRNILRHFRTKHGNYLGGKLRDSPNYPHRYYFKTIVPRKTCPNDIKPPLHFLHGVDGLNYKFLGLQPTSEDNPGMSEEGSTSESE